MVAILEIIRRLEGSLSIGKGEFIAYDVARETGDPFKILVATILSQNTSEANAYRAYDELKSRIGLEVHSIYRASLSELEESIRKAGLWKSKARAIKELANLIIERFNGEPNGLLKLTVDELRDMLLSIPGIGVKTIDVLLVNMGYGVIPLDTHILRVSRRLGLTEARRYDDVQRDLHKLIPPKLRLKAHLLLIKLGRTYCRARKPLCSVCVLNDICPKIGVEKE